MRILKVHARTVAVSRYADPRIPSGGLTTTAVAVVTDVAGIVGYGFSSIGRFGQTGLINDRFAPRLIAAGDLSGPLQAWDCMMKDEKSGGHGERCVAVGTLDMALWDAAAKAAGKPLYRLLQEGHGTPAVDRVPVYAGGGYYFPSDDIGLLKDEVRSYVDRGYTSVKIKIGGLSLGDDLRRIEAVRPLVPQLAVDAMNRYPPSQALEAGRALAAFGLSWFEDAVDPLDFEAHRALSEAYDPPLGIGEATFSVPDARNLIRYAGLRPDRDRLIFDPVHCYGLPGYLQIIRLFEESGWSRQSFHPHGGHLFSLHIAAGLGLGGSEDNPDIFQPFGGCGEVRDGFASPPLLPGIGFEGRKDLSTLFRELVND